MYKA